MVAAAKRPAVRSPVHAEAAAEERALTRLNRLFAKAAPLAARQREQGLKRLRDDIAARIRLAR
ncbi:MAG: hypothetical protein RLZZ15_52 [Verrucomicrobiota bacterium]|jgi:hypothetical protein